MPKKIEVNKAAEILAKNQLEPDVLRRIVEEFNLATETDEDKAPAIKKQFAVLVSDPLGLLPKEDFVCWVIQIPDDEAVATVEDRIRNASYTYNATRKGRLHSVATVGESLENVPSHTFKDVDLWVKTKTPVLMLRTNNEIPRDSSAKAA